MVSQLLSLLGKFPLYFLSGEVDSSHFLDFSSFILKKSPTPLSSTFHQLCTLSEPATNISLINNFRTSLTCNPCSSYPCHHSAGFGNHMVIPCKVLGSELRYLLILNDLLLHFNQFLALSVHPLMLLSLALAHSY